MVDMKALPGGRFDSAQAATYLGKSKSWLDRERSEGRGPKFRRVGGTIEYTQESLDAYLQACEVETADSRKAAA